MGLREDVEWTLKEGWEPKVPSPEVIQKQAIKRIEKGESTGNIPLDIKAIKEKEDDGEER